MNTADCRNKLTGLAVLAVVAGMLALSFASVPLYNLFCRVTGFGGTTQISQSLPDVVLDRTVTVKFITDTNRSLPWDFGPDQREVEVKLGQDALISYHARNNAKEPVAGTAIYNVTPAKAGKYFHKTQCFCFGEQVLNPGQSVSMPVVFYVDPAMDNDPNMEDVTTITLSYTFFKTDSPALEKALEAFYNQDNN